VSRPLLAGSPHAVMSAGAARILPSRLRPPAGAPALPMRCSHGLRNVTPGHGSDAPAARGAQSSQLIDLNLRTARAPAAGSAERSLQLDDLVGDAPAIAAGG